MGAQFLMSEVPLYWSPRSGEGAVSAGVRVSRGTTSYSPPRVSSTTPPRVSGPPPRVSGTGYLKGGKGVGYEVQGVGYPPPLGMRYWIP